MHIIHANIVYSEDRQHFAVHLDSYIAVDGGVVKGIWPVIPDEYKGAPLTDYGEAICPSKIADRSICIDGDIGEVLGQ